MQGGTDLTTGSITKKLLMVAIPIMGTQLLQMAYNLTDMFWLGRMADGTVAVAASGMGGMFLWLSMALMMFGRMGAEIGVAQSLGRGEPGEAERYARMATWMALILGVAFGGVLALFTEPLIGLFGIQEAAVRDASVTYLRIAAIGIPMTYVTGAITGAFNGAGNSRLSFLCNAVGLVVNMILDPVMIFTFGWGIAGAAIATVLAQGVVCALFVVFMKKHPARPLPAFKFRGKHDAEAVAQIGKWATPIAVESGAFTLLAMVVTAMVAQYSADAIAVQRIGSQIESMSWLIGGGFASAVTAFVGQNYGARQMDRIRRGFRISMTWLMGWEAFVTLVLVFFGSQLYSVFIQDPNIQSMGVTYLRILATCQFAMGLEGACSGTFRGMGQTIPPSLCSIASNLLRPVFCWALAQWLGLNGLWWGIALSAIVRGVAMAVWYFAANRKMMSAAAA